MGQGRLVRSVQLLFVFLLSACGSQHQGWGSFPVAIYADSQFLATGNMASDFQDAMTFWEAKAGKKLFDYKGTWTGNDVYNGAATAPSAINANVIFFQNPWPFSPSIIGQTTVNTSNTEIKASMIMINPNTSFCPGSCKGAYNSISERKVIAHELGHFLGLQHVNDINNLMYPESEPGGDLTAVTIDEVSFKALTQAN